MAIATMSDTGFTTVKSISELRNWGIHTQWTTNSVQIGYRKIGDSSSFRLRHWVRKQGAIWSLSKAVFRIQAVRHRFQLNNSVIDGDKTVVDEIIGTDSRPCLLTREIDESFARIELLKAWTGG